MLVDGGGASEASALGRLGSTGLRPRRRLPHPCHHRHPPLTRGDGGSSSGAGPNVADRKQRKESSKEESTPNTKESQRLALLKAKDVLEEESQASVNEHTGERSNFQDFNALLSKFKGNYLAEGETLSHVLGQDPSPLVATMEKALVSLSAIPRGVKAASINEVDAVASQYKAALADVPPAWCALAAP